MTASTDTLLSIRDLRVGFKMAQADLQAVRSLNLDIRAGAITCLVGESGCGKSLTCKAILKLLPQNALLKGDILFEGQNLLTLTDRELCKIRGASIGMIFQEPMTSLNPVLKIGKQAAEPLRLHKKLNKASAREIIIDLFTQVGITSPETRFNDYPHQLSGGMRQRVMIAMALSCKPRLLLADEPTTALDATIQGQILRLLTDESRMRAMAVLLITHDLGVVAKAGDYVGVMYAGSLVEFADVEGLFTHPLHPYTLGLMASAPGRDSAGHARLPTIPGTVPALDALPRGCPFQPRCSRAIPICSVKIPPATHDKGHMVACWLYESTSNSVLNKVP